jgi:hypothetical protein
MTGDWAVILEVFDDGSARVRVDSGEDIALRADQLPPDPQPGEAGHVFFRRQFGEGMALFRRGSG